MNIDTLMQKIHSASELDFGDIFNGSVELFKKVWAQGLLLMLFNVILVLPIVIILYAPIVAIAVAADGGYVPEDNPFVAGGLSIGMILLVTLLGLLVTTISLGLIAGFFKICKEVDHDRKPEISMFFSFLNGQYLGKLFTLSVIVILISVIALSLCILPIFYVMVPLSFLYAVLAFNSELSPMDVVKGAFAIGNKKWLLAFGLMLVIGICVQIISYFTCGLGAIFLGCFSYLPTYLIYKKAVGFEDEHEIDQIGTETF